MNEIAATILTPSIEAALLAEAERYPDVKVHCGRCHQSIMGCDWAAHIQEHKIAALPAPAHWEAL